MMAARLAHKGSYVSIWSPATDVWLGEIRHWPRDDAELSETAFSGQLYIDWQKVPDVAAAGPEARDRYQRGLAAGALRKDGLNAVDKLDGHFGIASWDGAKQQLNLIADRVNYENIYYTASADRTVFASEYKALLALPDVEARVDPATLQRAIGAFRPDFNGSRLAGIRRVRYGHAACIDGSGARVSRYFTPDCRPRSGNLADFATELRNILVEQARAWLGHHDRIAITLSGGLDSAGLLGILRHTFPDKKIASYTIGHGSNDPEIIGARECAQTFSTEHHEFGFQPASLQSDLPKIVWLAEEFAAREEAILQYQVEGQILGREPVLMGGHGADMVFLGMPRYRLVNMAERLPLFRKPLTEIYQQTQSGAPPSSLLGRIGSALLYRGKAIQPPVLAGAGGPTRITDDSRIADVVSRRLGGFRPYHYHSAIYSLAPLEIAMPFLSNAMMNFALTVPNRMKIDLRSQKIVLREALRPFLPDRVSQRGKAIQRAKRTTELSDVLDGMAGDLLSKEQVRARGLIDPAYVSKIRRRPQNGIYAGDQLLRLWMLISAELWCRTFIDERGLPDGFSADDCLASEPPPIAVNE